MLRSFTQDDRDHMVENEKIAVTCEFCSQTYTFDPEEILRAPEPAAHPRRRRRGLPGPSLARR
jgi:hypothetical protein